MRRNVRLITSIACGVLAAMLAFLYGESARAEVRAERSEVLERYGGEVTNLVVARMGLSTGTVISESNVEVREWLADLAPAGAITSLDDIVGVRLTSSVAAGEPLNELDVASGDGVLEVPSGRVAISVRLTDKTGLTSAVAKGARVVAYRNVDDSLKALTNNALVLSVSGGAEYSSSQSICLAVLPSSVEDVLAASSDGSLRLALPGEGVMNPVTSDGEDGTAQTDDAVEDSQKDSDEGAADGSTDEGESATDASQDGEAAQDEAQSE